MLFNLIAKSDLPKFVPLISLNLSLSTVSCVEALVFTGWCLGSNEPWGAYQMKNTQLSFLSPRPSQQIQCLPLGALYTQNRSENWLGVSDNLTFPSDSIKNEYWNGALGEGAKKEVSCGTTITFHKQAACWRVVPLVFAHTIQPRRMEVTKNHLLEIVVINSCDEMEKGSFFQGPLFTANRDRDMAFKGRLITAWHGRFFWHKQGCF